MGLTPRAGSSPAFGTIFYVYAHKSIKHNFIYVGMTEYLDARIVRHNKDYVKSTKRFALLELFYYESCEDGIQASEREKFLKSTSGKSFLRSVFTSYRV